MLFFQHSALNAGQWGTLFRCPLTPGIARTEREAPRDSSQYEALTHKQSQASQPGASPPAPLVFPASPSSTARQAYLTPLRWLPVQSRMAPSLTCGCRHWLQLPARRHCAALAAPQALHPRPDKPSLTCGWRRRRRLPARRRCAARAAAARRGRVRARAAAARRAARRTASLRARDRWVNMCSGSVRVVGFGRSQRRRAVRRGGQPVCARVTSKSACTGVG